MYYGCLHYESLPYPYYAVPDPAVRYGPRALGIIRRQTMLQTRDRDAATLLNLTMMPLVGSQTLDVAALAPPYEEILDLNQIDDEALGVSAIFDHLAQLARYRTTAEQVRDDIVSALVYSGNTPLVFMLLQHHGTIALALYDLASQRLRSPRTEAEVLNVIACEPHTDSGD